MTLKCVGSFECQQTVGQRSKIDYSDEGHNKILVRGSHQKVSSALCKTLKAASSDENAYGKEIDNSGNLLLVYRLKEHPWTIIEPPTFQPVNKHPVLKSHIAEAFSASTETDAIFYNYQPYEERFDVYVNGNLKEKFSSFFKGELGYQQETNDIEVDKLHVIPKVNSENYFYFYPDVSDKELRDITSQFKRRMPCALSTHFLSKYKVYVPYIHWLSRISSDTVNLSIEGLKKDDFEEFCTLRLNSPLI